MFGRSTKILTLNQNYFSWSRKAVGLLAPRAGHLNLENMTQFSAPSSLPLPFGGVCDKSSEITRRCAGLTNRHQRTHGVFCRNYFKQNFKYHGEQHGKHYARGYCFAFNLRKLSMTPDANSGRCWWRKRTRNRF